MANDNPKKPSKTAAIPATEKSITSELLRKSASYHTKKKMKIEIKEAWVSAMRSRKYKKGIGHLRNKENEFCPLGVLCDLYDSSSWISSSHYWYYFAEDNVSGTLPQVVRDWAGLDKDESSCAFYSKDDKESTEQIINLFRLNDNSNLSFNQLAGIIEHYY